MYSLKTKKKHELEISNYGICFVSLAKVNVNTPPKSMLNPCLDLDNFLSLEEFPGPV